MRSGKDKSDCDTDDADMEFIDQAPPEGPWSTTEIAALIVGLTAMSAVFLAVAAMSS